MAESDMRAEIIARLDSGKPASSADVLRLLQENENLEAENARLLEELNTVKRQLAMMKERRMKEDIDARDRIAELEVSELQKHIIAGKLADEAAAQKRRIAELEAALRPFANVAISEQVIDPEVGDTDCFSAEAWMLRKVIAVLGEKDSPEEEDAI